MRKPIKEIARELLQEAARRRKQAWTADDIVHYLVVEHNMRSLMYPSVAKGYVRNLVMIMSKENYGNFSANYGAFLFDPKLLKEMYEKLAKEGKA